MDRYVAESQWRSNRWVARDFSSKWMVPAIRIAGIRMIGGALNTNTAMPTIADVTVPTIRALWGDRKNWFINSTP